MLTMENLDESVEPLSFDEAYSDMGKLQNYMGKVGINETYRELYAAYEGSVDNPAKYDHAFFAVGNKLHEEYEDDALPWVDLLAKERHLALTVSAYKKRRPFPGRRMYGDYRSGPNFPQDLYIND